MQAKYKPRDEELNQLNTQLAEIDKKIKDGGDVSLRLVASDDGPVNFRCRRTGASLCEQIDHVEHFEVFDGAEENRQHQKRHDHRQRN